MLTCHYLINSDQNDMPVTEFRVGMTCEGCSNACTRILSKVEGVTQVECDIGNQLVKVHGTGDPDVMLAKLMKWSTASGKSVALL